MKRLLWILPIVPLCLAGCGGVKKSLGMERNPPDEFAVVERAPLVVPPDFNLAPPRPGAKGPQDVAVKTSAGALVMGQGTVTNAASSKASAGENALLSQIGTKSDPNIRQELHQADDTAEASTVTEKLGIATPESGKALNPVDEAQKLKAQKVKTTAAPLPATKPAKK